MTRSTTAPSPLWAPDRRATTTGILLLVTLVAFENMGVGTAMPRIVAELHAESLYSWPFTAFLAASVVGTVLSGRISDQRGPLLPMLAAPALFCAGLVVAGVAGSMPVLLVGRVLQGFGCGVQIVAVSVLIASVYPTRDRPAVFGAISAAWVVPSLFGPTLSGLITEHVSWRLVFLGLAPLVLLGVLLLVPLLRGLAATTPQETTPQETTEASGTTRRGLPLAALAAAVGLSALTWAGEHPSLGTLLLGVAGLAALVPALRRLLPTGTLLARSGLPAVVLARALLGGSFFAAQAYLPLTLTSVHDLSPALAGVPLTVGSLGWSAAAWWQARHPDLPRQTLLRVGLLLLAAGLALVTFVAPTWGKAWLVYPAWVLAGAGMGLGTTSISVLVLHLSQPAERGFNSAAMQLSEMLGQTMFIGLGGVLLAGLATAEAPTPAVLPLDVLMAAVALLGALVAARRIQAVTPATSAERTARAG